MSRTPRSRRRHPVATGVAVLATAALGAGVAYAAAGEQDPTFNDGGAQLIGFDSPSNVATRVVVAPDGSIVVAGCGCEGDAGASIALAKLTPGGAIDEGFGTDGKVLDQGVGSLSNAPSALALGADGEIYVGVRSFSYDEQTFRTAALWGGGENGSGDLTVVRYAADGTREGISRIAVPGYGGNVVSLLPQPDGGLLVVGDDGSEGELVLARLDADGALDPDYDSDGLVLDRPFEPGPFEALGAGHQPGGPAGSVLVAGETHDDTPAVFTSRYTAAGELDESYGDHGVASVPDATGYTPGAFAIAPDGSSYVGGGTTGFVVRHALAAGAPDPGWGAAGKAEVTFESSDDAQANSVGVQPDGKVVAGGYVGDRAVVVRFLANGTPDPAFGTNGVFVLPLTAGVDMTTGTFLAVQPDGKSVLVGEANGFEESTETDTTDTTTYEALTADRTATRDLRLVRRTSRFYVTRVDGGVVTPPTGTTTDPATTTTTTTATTDTAPPAPAPAATPGTVAAAGTLPLPSARSCVSRRSFKIRLRIPRGAQAASATVRVNGKKVAVVRGARLKAAVDLRGLPKGRVTVAIAVKLADGSTLKGERRYRTCVAKRAGGTPKV